MPTDVPIMFGIGSRCSAERRRATGVEQQACLRRICEDRGVGGTQRRIVNGVDIAWLESGAGPSVLMLHGLAGDGAQSYAPVMHHLEGYHCFAPWARGHGQSAWADRYLIEDHAQDAAEFIDEVIGEPTLILGFSLGSMTAAYVAVHRPELVRGLFLEDSPLLVLQDPERHRDETYLALFTSVSAVRRSMVEHGRSAEWLRHQVGGFTSVVPGSTDTFREVLPAEAIAMMASLMVDNDPAVCDPARTLPTAELVRALPPDDLARINCPVHLLAGQWELGGSLPPRDLARWLELVPHATSREISDVGHAIRFAPHTFPIYLSELDDFLGRVAQAG